MNASPFSHRLSPLYRSSFLCGRRARSSCLILRGISAELGYSCSATLPEAVISSRVAERTEEASIHPQLAERRASELSASQNTSGGGSHARLTQFRAGVVLDDGPNQSPSGASRNRHILRNHVNGAARPTRQLRVAASQGGCPAVHRCGSGTTTGSSCRAEAPLWPILWAPLDSANNCYYLVQQVLF